MAMTPRISSELDQALTRQNGFVQADGADGKVIVMSLRVYREMLGIGTDAELEESLKAIEEGTADIEAGRTIPMEQVFRELDEKYGVHR